MSDLYIRIKTLLEKASPAEVDKVQKDIQSKMQPVRVNIVADNKNLDKFSKTTKQIGEEATYTSEKIKEWTKSLGVTVKQTELLDKASGNVVETIEKTTTSYKEMDKVHGQALKMNEKINASIIKQNELVKSDQSKMWSQRVKETMESMTRKPEGLKQMADYYKQLEVSSKNVTDQTFKQTLAQKDLLTQIKSIRGKDIAFVSDENLVRLNKLETGIKNLDPAHRNFSKGLDSAKSQLRAVNADIGIYKKQVQDASKYTNIFGQSLFEAGKKFAGWMLIATLIMQPIRLFRQGIEDLKEIDNQLVQLRKVTGESVEVMREYAFQANKVASRMGATTAEVIEQTVAWSRLGYSIRDASKLAEESILLSVVGNMSVERSTTALISVLKAFNMEADKARIVIDAINEVNLLLAS